MNVLVVGAGKVGRALALRLREAGASVSVVRARSVARRKGFGADLLIVAAADPWVARVARTIVDRLEAAPRALRPAAVVHVAGGLGLEALDAFRSVSIPVGQMHPLLSFAGAPPALDGATMRVDGDPGAIRAAREVARLLGMVARRFERLPPAAYHAAAALVANGAVGLVGAAASALALHGVPRDVAARMFGRLLASVAENVSGLGLPAALTGPVRRGDAAAIERHLAHLDGSVKLYRAVVTAQLGMARELGEATESALDRIEELVRANPKKDPRRRKRPG
ncbi:MAG: DUF2520 domain-containing protein [Polyangiaceae bacterium]